MARTGKKVRSGRHELVNTGEVEGGEQRRGVKTE